MMKDYEPLSRDFYTAFGFCDLFLDLLVICYIFLLFCDRNDHTSPIPRYRCLLVPKYIYTSSKHMVTCGN
jgi:hypothetical protein